MPSNSEDFLTDIVQQMSSVKRKSLLPWWIKVFMWVFLIFGIIAPVGIIFGFLGYNFQLSLYGLETSDPISIIGICIISLFLLKGVISYGLLRESDWAITLAIYDSAIGIILCVLIMLFPIFSSHTNSIFSFGLELFILIPYLNKLIKIRPAWESIL